MLTGCCTVRMGWPRVSGERKHELWACWRAGDSISQVSVALSKPPGSIHYLAALSWRRSSPAQTPPVFPVPFRVEIAALQSISLAPSS